MSGFFSLNGSDNDTSGLISEVVDKAFGDGVTDATAHIQGKIDACPVGGSVFLPAGTYRLTAALTITKHITMTGEGLAVAHGSMATQFNAIDMPVSAPYLVGSVLLQQTAGENGITVSGAGLTANLRDFGIRFADAIRFVNTGHGIYYRPPLVPSQTYRDNGLMSALWENVAVFGHDGNHYAYYLTNSLYCTLRHLRFFGGGGLFIENDGKSSGGDAQFYGNMHVDHFYGQLFLAGSADGIRCKNTSGALNLLQFTRPQVSATDKTAVFPGTTPPSHLTQKTINIEPFVKSYSIVAPNFESNVNVGVTLSNASGSQFIAPGGLINFGVGPTGYQMMRTNDGSIFVNQDYVTQTGPGYGTGTVVLNNIAGVGAALEIGKDAKRVLATPGPVSLKPSVVPVAGDVAADGGVLYVEGGALKYRGSSGTVTVVAQA